MPYAKKKKERKNIHVIPTFKCLPHHAIQQQQRLLLSPLLLKLTKSTTLLMLTKSKVLNILLFETIYIIYI